MNQDYREEEVDYDPYVEDAENEKCPECGSHRIVRYMQANGPDDFDWIYECLDCGCTQST